MTTRLRAVIGSLLCLFATSAWSGQTNARIQYVLLYEGGNLIYVYPVGGVQNPPACHGSNGDYYSFSMSRSMAKEYLAALLAAQASGKEVWFVGTGTCTDQSVSETISYIMVRS